MIYYSPPPIAKGLSELEVKLAQSVALHILSGKGVIDYELVGSAAYCLHPNDVDYAALFGPDDDFQSFVEDCYATGWTECRAENGKKYDQTNWTILRRGPLNFLLTQDREQYMLYTRAMRVCRALNLRDKAQRVLVCQIIQDGVNPFDDLPF